MFSTSRRDEWGTRQRNAGSGDVTLVSAGVATCITSAPRLLKRRWRLLLRRLPKSSPISIAEIREPGVPLPLPASAIHNPPRAERVQTNSVYEVRPQHQHRVPAHVAQADRPQEVWPCSPIYLNFENALPLLQTALLPNIQFDQLGRYPDSGPWPVGRPAGTEPTASLGCPSRSCLWLLPTWRPRQFRLGGKRDCRFGP
jgi:hypothetical protein